MVLVLLRRIYVSVARYSWRDLDETDAGPSHPILHEEVFPISQDFPGEVFQIFGAGEREFAAGIRFAGVPRELAGTPGVRQHLEGPEGVDGQVADAPAPGRGRGDQRPPGSGL